MVRDKTRSAQTALIRRYENVGTRLSLRHKALQGGPPFTLGADGVLAGDGPHDRAVTIAVED